MSADPNKANLATSRATLEQHICDVNIPKNEAEWWAHGEIERLRVKYANGGRVAASKPFVQRIEAQIKKLEAEVIAFIGELDAEIALLIKLAKEAA